MSADPSSQTQEASFPPRAPRGGKFFGRHRPVGGVGWDAGSWGSPIHCAKATARPRENQVSDLPLGGINDQINESNGITGQALGVGMDWQGERWADGQLFPGPAYPTGLRGGHMCQATASDFLPKSSPHIGKLIPQESQLPGVCLICH